MHTFRFYLFIVIAGIAMLLCSGLVSADPPSRVARLGYLSGAVSFSPAGERDWGQANINRPLTIGDRLWADQDARVEIQMGGAMVRMGANSGVSVLNLDDQITQLQLTEGTLNVRVRSLAPGQLFEVDTPNLAFTLRQPGAYRIEAEPDGNATTIFVRQGQGEVYGDNTAYMIDSRQAYRFLGTDLHDYEYVDAPRFDEFDRWSNARDRLLDNSISARYVSQDVIGYQDLDANGSWRLDATYGNVWIPNRVATDWAPYRDGHWAWVDPWGWTWVDDAPWGFAVSHYGRWANMHGTWGWVPGPVHTRAYYAPALVVFVGGDNFQLTLSSGRVGGVAWFPLAPREVYRPAYSVSRGYFENINRSNTVINNTIINNIYTNKQVMHVDYANRHVPGAVIAVPRTTFVQSQPVSRTAIRVSSDVAVSGAVAVAPPVAPTQQSVHGDARQGRKPPPSHVFEQPVVARTVPPPAHAGFEQQQQQLTEKPGRPLDEAARKDLKPKGTLPVPAVKLILPTQTMSPAVMPPPAAPAGRAAEGRGRPDTRTTPVSPRVTAPTTPAQEPQGRPEPRGIIELRGRPASPSPQPQIVPPATLAPHPTTPSAPAVPVPEQKNRIELRSPQPQGAAPMPIAPRQITPATPVTPMSEQRGRPEPRGNPEAHRPPQMAPVSPPAVAPPAAAPRQTVPAAPITPIQEQRGKPEPRGNGESRGQVLTSPSRVVPPPAQIVFPAQKVPQEAAPQDPKGKPDVVDPKDRKNDRVDQKREEEILRKQEK
ncbi:MAG: hypothetical protein P4L87_13965 [Formivibrio sp.]|nr:hypothetical protein [Formivibrio sp.]